MTLRLPIPGRTGTREANDIVARIIENRDAEVQRALARLKGASSIASSPYVNRIARVLLSRERAAVT